MHSVDSAYRESIHTPIEKAAEELQDILSRQLTAYAIGVKDGQTVARWAGGDVHGMRRESERRIRAAYGILQILRTRYESPQTLRAWFIGMNPALQDESPAHAIRNGHLREAMAAAYSFVHD